MIALVEGAQRQKTPNEIALSIVLSGLTIIFVLVKTDTMLKELIFDNNRRR
jgi:high-affinity K+ transport system ATPase subunit B